MKKLKKKSIKAKLNLYTFFTCFLACIVLFTNVVRAEENRWVNYDGELLGESCYLIEVNSGVKLFEYNKDKRMFPASLVKIMTALVVLDNVDNLDEKVTFSYNSVTYNIDKDSTTIGASAGDVLTVKDCIYSILVSSANDAANALAEHVAGNIKDFVLLMNMKAKSLSMNDTNFVNPTGLHDDNQYTTAHDLAILTAAAMKKEIFRQAGSSRSYKHAPIRRYKDPNNSNNTILNTNGMLAGTYRYRGTIAGKTGYTKESGYNLVSCTERDGMLLAFVVLGCKKINDRYIDAKNVLDFYYTNYHSFSIRDNDKRFNRDNYNFTINDIVLVETINITVDENVTVTIPKDVNFEDLESVISYIVEYVDDPYSIGTVSYYLDGKLVGKCSLEGKNIDNEKILVAYINLSQNVERVEDGVEQNSSYINVDLPIYRDDSGNIKLSKPMLVIVRILLFLMSLTILVIFFNSKYFDNLRKILYNKWVKLKRRF